MDSMVYNIRGSQSVFRRVACFVKFCRMPELARFYGIIIRMFCEPAGQHHTPHFHAYHGEDTAVYAISPVRRMAGAVPLRERHLVKAWVELHREELLANWQRLREGRLPLYIEPLR